MMLSCVMACLLYLNLVYATTFQSRCPEPISPEVDCTLSTNELDCSTDEICEIHGQVCCFNGCKKVCKNPVYYKAFCPENDILSSPNEWTKFCLGDCNCPDDMQCCPGPCETHVCRLSIKERVDCPSPETYNCDASIPTVISCTGHNDCIGNDHLCCPDGCNNRYCQNPEYHEDHTSHTELACTVTTMQPTTSGNCTSSCYDITMLLGGMTPDMFFPEGTNMIDNSASKCAAFCKLSNFPYAITNLGTMCFCYGGTFSNVMCLPSESCGSSCPGGGAEQCGGTKQNIVNIYKTGTVTISDAQNVHFPSGKCYGPILPTDWIPEMLLTDPMSILVLTPTTCRDFCNNNGFAYCCTYTGGVCGCFSTFTFKAAEFQEYCIAPCPGDPLGVPNGITCGSLPPPGIPFANCINIV